MDSLQITTCKLRVTQDFLKKTLYFAKLKSMIEIFVNINCLMMKTLVPTVTEQLNDRQTDQPTVR